MHRVFDSPRDAIIFDTGHQAYVHKMLTGRLGLFDTLRQQGGMSGYPSRHEFEHDLDRELARVDGAQLCARLRHRAALRGETGKVVCVVGDGALTGGMA